jgi:hypothetical protein
MKLTMSVLPAATPPAGTVIAVAVLVVVSPPEPTRLMNAMPGPAPVQPGLEASAGQTALAPLQVSMTSQLSLTARQTTPAGWTPSTGHAALAPVQVSLASQTSVAVRQMPPATRTPSAGQTALAPVQLSVASQRSVAARQTVAAG